MADRELIRVTDRRAASQARAFPRDPDLTNTTNGPAGTVGPDSDPTTAGDAEPVILDGDQLVAATPGPRLAPMAWSGWPSAWQTSWSSVGGGGAMDPVLANRVSTVFTCGDLNGSALGSMPVTMTERGRPMDPEEYAWTENPEPRVYSSWDEFVVQVYLSLATRGDAYIHATDWDRDTLLPSRFMVLDPDQVTVAFDADGIRRYELQGDPLYTPDVCHLRYLTIAGWPNGLSPLQGAAGNLRSAGALERYGAGLAERGGVTWGVLTSDQRLTSRQAALAQQQWVESAQNRLGAPAVVGYGLKLDTLSLSPRDMALLDLRVFDEQRIAAAFGVPPFLIGLPQPEGLTYANAGSLFEFHWRRLRPVAKRLTGALSAWALPRGRRIQLNAGDYVQASLAERTNAYGEMHDRGALLTDEWRALEQLPPLPPGAAPNGRQQQQNAATVASTSPGTATLQ